MTNVQLMHGDCLELLPTLAPASVDMVLADLPYAQTQAHWDTLIPFEPLWKEYKRVIKPNGVIVLTASQPFTSMLVMSNLAMFKYALVWDKSLVTGFLDANNKPLRRHEDVLVFYDALPTYNPQKAKGKPYTRPSRPPTIEIYGEFKEQPVINETGDRYPTSILNIPNATRGKNVHPTEKPVALMSYLIQTYTNEGDTVLDNCFGSGSTGVACMQTGRRFIGMEKDTAYFFAAQERICEASFHLFG